MSTNLRIALIKGALSEDLVYTYVYFTFEESTINVQHIPSSNIFMQVARKYILTHAPTQEI